VQSNGRVVLVEPDDLICGLLEQWLTEAGYATASQTLAAFAEREIGAVPPRLVIADIPSLDSGAVIVDRIRQTYGGPLLLLSARFRCGLGSSRTAACRFGVRKVLPKPFARDELLQAVKEAIG
jgi:DNA-binding response OmpR family regulator